MRGDNLHEYVIWSEYLSPDLSRGRGRRVRRASAPSRVTPELVLRACNELNWKCRVEEGRYPRTWFEPHGFKIIVEFESKIASKNSVIKSLADKLKEIGERKV